LSLVALVDPGHAQVLAPNERIQTDDGSDGGRARQPAQGNLEPYRPFAGGAAGLPAAPSSLAVQTLVTPRSQAYLPSALPLPERLAAGQGMRVGSFALQAVTSTSLAYDDNINASNEDRESDFIWSVNQSVRAQSLFRRHSLGFQASAGTGQYLQHRSDSEINWLVGTDGRLDFDRNSSLSANLTYTRDEEDPEAEDAAANADDNVYHLVNGGASYNHRFRLFNWSLTGNASRIEYENGDDNGRDRWSYGVATSLGYDVNDRLSLNLTPTYNRSFYDESSDEDGEDEDTYGYSLSVGANYEVGPRLSANGSIGYSWQFADDETQGVIFSGGLFYVIDGSTSAALSVGRSIGDTDVEGASTEISTTASLSLTRALRRDMAVGVSLGASRNEFEGISRKDDNVFATVGYGYAVNDSIALTASYRYSQRFSGENEEDFNRNLFVIGLTFRL
jgi:hypothetical protein